MCVCVCARACACAYACVCIEAVNWCYVRVGSNCLFSCILTRMANHCNIKTVYLDCNVCVRAFACENERESVCVCVRVFACVYVCVCTRSRCMLLHFDKHGQLVQRQDSIFRS